MLYISLMELTLPPIRFCPRCGAATPIKAIEGRERPVCGECGHIVYINPTPATTLVAIDDGRVLLTLRDVDPCRGEWCLPGGFLEWGEAPKDGARRELVEETGITAGALELIGVYDSVSTAISHVVLMGFRVLDWTGEARAGDDAADAAWFALNDMPRLAFEAHRQMLADAVRNSNLT